MHHLNIKNFPTSCFMLMITTFFFMLPSFFFVIIVIVQNNIFIIHSHKKITHKNYYYAILFCNLCTTYFLCILNWEFYFYAVIFSMEK
jgi:hypothetical protein